MGLFFPHFARSVFVDNVISVDIELPIRIYRDNDFSNVGVRTASLEAFVENVDDGLRVDLVQ